MTPPEGASAVGSDRSVHLSKPIHGETELSLPACHAHGVYYGDDNWDADCCICCDSPCDSVDVERMRRHRLWERDRADRRLQYAIDNKGVMPEAPF